MKLRVLTQLKSQSGALVAPVFSDDLTKMPSIWPNELKEFLKTVIKDKEFKAEKGEVLFTYFTAKGLPNKLLLVGMGDGKDLKAKRVRDAGGRVGKTALSKKLTEINVLISPHLENNLQEFVEGLLFSQNKIDKLKTKQPKNSTELKTVNIIVKKSDKRLTESVTKAQTLAEAEEFIKDLVNNPSNIVDSEYMAKQARAIAKEIGGKCTVISQKQLEKKSWGGLLAVNQGSKNEAKCLVVEYSGAKSKKEAPIVLVGKGIIFDTGGYNLKPTRSIETMHQDMAGAATVLGVMSILKKLGIKKNVVAITPVAENLVSSTAYRPSDIITMLSGHTVEITNTDAEGRMVLADGLTHATTFNPAQIITIATLTGAVAIALGDRFAGLFGNDETLRNALHEAGEEVDDRAWGMPIINCYRRKMDSKVADLRNYDMETGRLAGSSKAAAFLEKFIGDNKWCHIDIGGTAFTSDPKPYQTTGATAHGFQMLVRFLEK